VFILLKSLLNTKFSVNINLQLCKPSLCSE